MNSIETTKVHQQRAIGAKCDIIDSGSLHTEPSLFPLLEQSTSSPSTRNGGALEVPEDSRTDSSSNSAITTPANIEDSFRLMPVPTPVSPVSTTSIGSESSIPQGCTRPGLPRVDNDAKTSALKALAGIGRVVSRSRQVDAEALQAIKAQRARAKAEGISVVNGYPGHGHTRKLSSDSMPDLGNSRGQSTHGTISSQTLSRPQHRRSHSSLHPPTSHATLPLTSPGAYTEFLARRTLPELLALQRAVEAEIARQINSSTASVHQQKNSLAGGTPPSPSPSSTTPTTDSMVSAQYATALANSSHQKEQQDQAVALQQALAALNRLSTQSAPAVQAQLPENGIHHSSHSPSYGSLDGASVSSIPCNRSGSSGLNFSNADMQQNTLAYQPLPHFKDTATSPQLYGEKPRMCDLGAGTQNSMFDLENIQQKHDDIHNFASSTPDFSFLNESTLMGLDFQGTAPKSFNKPEHNFQSQAYLSSLSHQSPSKSVNHPSTSHMRAPYHSNRPPRPQVMSYRPYGHYSATGSSYHGGFEKDVTQGREETDNAPTDLSLFPNLQRYSGALGGNLNGTTTATDRSTSISGTDLWR